MWKAVAIAGIWLTVCLAVWKLPIFDSGMGALTIMAMYVCALVATGMIAYAPGAEREK